MKFLLAVFLIVGGLWLWLAKSGEKASQAKEVVESSRRVLDAQWRALPEREMAIGDMERYAAGLSDEELWEIFEGSSLVWLSQTGSKTWKTPPKLAVMFARELGRRGGLDGVKRVVSFIETLAESQIELSPEEQSKFQELNMSLRYGAFGGWSYHKPEEAILNVIEKAYNRVDPFEIGVEKENYPLSFLNSNLVGGFGNEEFWAGERVLRDAFFQLAQNDVELAIDLLNRGVELFLFDPNQIVESILPFTDDHAFLNELGKVDDYELFHLGIWEEKVDLSNEYQPGIRERLLFGVISRARPEEAARLIMDGSISFEKRAQLFQWSVLYDHQNIELVNEFREERRFELISKILTEPRGVRFGPIDRKEGRKMPDWKAHYGKLRQVVEDSDWDVVRKREILDQIEDIVSE